MTNEAMADQIQQKYQQLGFSKGWNFLACHEERLKDARIAIIGANPGGGGTGDDYQYRGIWSCSENAFCSEESFIRSQVQEWHRLLGLMAEETLCAQFIPFRSPDLVRLGQRKEAIAFARDLWRWALDISPASLFVTIGALPANNLVDILGAKLVATGLPTGWGKVTIDVWDSPCGRRIVRMPHPSRYKLFRRADGASTIAEEYFCAACGLDESRSEKSDIFK